MRLWTYRYWHPTYKEWVILDCCAETVEAALRSAVRFTRRQNRRYKRLDIPWRVFVPGHVFWMRPEPPV